MDRYDKQINFLMAKKNISKKQAKIKQLKLELFKTDHYYLFLFYKKFIKKGDKVHVDTFTKRWINRIMWFSCVWISYIHNKPLREESTIIWMFSASGFFLSADGGLLLLSINQGTGNLEYLMAGGN